MAKEATIGHLIEVIKAENQQTRSETKSNTAQLVTLNKTMSDYFKTLKAGELDDLEKERESKSKSGKEGGSKFGGMVGDAKDFGFLGMVGAIIAAVGGFLFGIVDGFKDALTLVLKLLGRTFKGAIIKPLSKVINFFFGGFIKAFRTNFMAGFKNVDKQIKSFGKVVDVRLKDFTTFAGKVGAVLGKVVNFGKALQNYFVSVGNRLGSLGKILRLDKLGGVFKSITGFFTTTGKQSTSITQLISNALKSMKFGPEITRFINGIKEIGDVFRRTAGVADTVADGGKTVGTFFSRIGSLFQTIGNAVKPLFGVFRTIGRVVFFPLTLIMTVMDSIKGAIEGFEQEGILGGIFGAIGGALSGLIGMPLDLLKSAIAWIADKLGFENFAETLESFSIAQMIKDMFMKVAELLNDAFGFIGRKIASVFGLEPAEPEVPQEPKEKPRSEMNRFERIQDNQRRERERLEGKKTKPVSQLEFNKTRLASLERMSQKGDLSSRQADELERRRKAVERMERTENAGGGVVAVNNAPTTNTTNNTTAMYGEPTPATDDLDRNYGMSPAF
jgi:hypothetical protein